MTVGKVSANFHVEVAETANLEDLNRRSANVPGLPMWFAADAQRIAYFERRRHYNISHRVHTLHFGERVLSETVAPLDGVVNAPEYAGQQHYLMKVIPTLVDRGLSAVSTNQYSLAEQFIRFDALAIPP